MKKGDEKAPGAAPRSGEALQEPAPKAADASRDPSRVKELEEERDRLRRQIQDLQEKHLRARADYDNLAKRASKEVQDTVRFVKSGLLLRVAMLVETFESAVPDAEKRLGADAKGLRLVLDDARKLLREEGVKEIATKGLPFNYRFHQAVDRVETSGVAEGTIVDVVQRGYLLGDEILRPALVKVAVPPKASAHTSPTDAKS